jgi:lantibiotic modifying enzyme
LRACFQNSPQALNIASGVAGQGIALLNCSPNLPDSVTRPLLKQIAETLRNTQQTNGSWKLSKKSKIKQYWPLGLSYGVAGLIYFLLLCTEQQRDHRYQKSIRIGLAWLFRQLQTRPLRSLWDPDAKNGPIKWYDSNLDLPGIMLAFIKAYEVLRDPAYKELSEALLYHLPTEPTLYDFSQAGGLARIGEMYLEAYRVFNTHAWKHRAGWIASLFTHTFLENEQKMKFWAVSIFTDFEPDLMTGSSGIIHFLMRYHQPEKIGPILLSNQISSK